MKNVQQEEDNLMQIIDRKILFEILIDLLCHIKLVNS